MPRRRMIDPEFWSDELIGNFKRDVRLFYIGLWNFSDDEGRFRAKTGLLKGQIFPYDADIKQKHIENFLKVLENSNRIVLYSHNGQSFGCVCKFKEHQTISHPTPSKIPPPPEQGIPEKFRNDSGATPSQVKLSKVKKDKNLLAPSAGFSDQQTVEKFIGKETTFGSGGKEKNLAFRDEVKKVCLAYIARLQEWGEEIDDENKAVNKVFGLMMSLICYGVPKKPKKIKNFHGHFTEPQKAIQLINRMSKPRDPVAELVHAFQHQPGYLP